MALNTGNSAGILRPEDVQNLVVEPLTRQSVAMQVSTVIETQSERTRFPVVQSDPTTGWTGEGEEIAISDADIDEVEADMKKLAGLTVVSSELAEDTDPAAMEVVGDGLVRDLQVRLDNAFFADTPIAKAPAGIGTLAGVQEVPAGSVFTNLDPFAQALSLAETVDSNLVRSFVAHPSTLLSLSQLKIGADWNLPLLGADPTSPTKRSVLGTPIYWSPAVDPNDVWLITAAKSFVVIRTPVAVEADRSAFFSSDQVAIRGRIRVGFAWPHPASVVRITRSGS